MLIFSQIYQNENIFSDHLPVLKYKLIENFVKIRQNSYLLLLLAVMYHAQKE
jgi:hypothetical protein